MRSENDSVLSSSGSVAHSQRLKRAVRIQLKVVECGRFGLESRDGFDEAGDGEGVADAAGAADQTEHTAFAGELDGDAHERGDPGTVNLWDAVQDSDNFLRATLDHRFERVVELLGRLTDSEAAVNFQYGHSAGFAHVDFHGQPVSHGRGSIHPQSGSDHHAPRRSALYAGGYLAQREPFGEIYGSNRPEPQDSGASEKQIQGMKISNCDQERACV